MENKKVLDFTAIAPHAHGTLLGIKQALLDHGSVSPSVLLSILKHYEEQIDKYLEDENK